MSESPQYAPPPRTPAQNDVTSLGVWFFSAVAGVALVLAAVFLFRSSAGHPWLRAAIGLGAGAALVAVAELWIAAKYRITANALDAAGVGILYATFYSMHARWAIVPLWVAFIGMLIVTAAAVVLAVRRDSMFIAVLGLIGGFVNAYLLSTTENYPLAVFAYLLALNIGIAWLAVRKGWWLLSALSVVLTAIYEWAWALQAITVGRLLIAAAIFAVFAVVGTVPLWHPRAKDCPARYRWLAAAAAHLPLLFAIYVAGQTNYGPQYNTLFAFLLLIDAGLLAIVWRGGPKWLHAAGGIATLITWIIWLRVSYTHASWPWLLAWAALFIVLYLVKVTPFAGLLFGLFIGIAIREPQHWPAIVVAMLVMLAIVVVVTLKQGRPLIAATAIALCCVALMFLHPPLWILIALHALLFAALFALAWISERHVLAILAVPFFVAMIIAAYSPGAWAQYPGWTLLAIAAVPYLLFIAYPLALGARVKASLDPYIAAALASLVLLVVAWPEYAGIVALIEAALMAVLLWLALRLEPREPRVTLLATLALAFFNVALPLLLPQGWVVVLWAIECVALVWLFTRVGHPVALLWGVGLGVVVFFRLAFDADLFAVYWRSLPLHVAIYVGCGVAMFVAAYIIRYHSPLLQRIFSIFCLFELWFLINILIANYFHSANGAVAFDFATSQPLEAAAYTISWAAIATGLLVLSYLIRWPAARGAALALLVAAVAKAFLSDLPRLTGPYLTASLVGLGLSVAVVAIVLQRRWAGKSIGLDLPVRNAGVSPAG
ncbi:MAG: DUF2339 domain-containing protein [Acidobacteriota bacterium]